MLTFGVIAGLILLYSCADRLITIAGYLKDVRSSLSQIQLETDGLIQRFSTIEAAIEDIQTQAQNIASVAESYEDEVLRPVRTAHAEADFFDSL